MYNLDTFSFAIKTEQVKTVSKHLITKLYTARRWFHMYVSGVSTMHQRNQNDISKRINKMWKRYARLRLEGVELGEGGDLGDLGDLGDSGELMEEDGELAAA